MGGSSRTAVFLAGTTIRRLKSQEANPVSVMPQHGQLAPRYLFPLWIHTTAGLLRLFDLHEKATELFREPNQSL